MKKPQYTRHIPRPPSGKRKLYRSYNVDHGAFGVLGYFDTKCVVSRIARNIPVAMSARSCALQEISIERQKSKRTSKRIKEWLVYKRYINELIKTHTKALKSAIKALKAKAEITGVIDDAPNGSLDRIAGIPYNKPLDVFQRHHPSSQPEAIEAVRNSPEAIAYIQETFADIDSGPFKGMFKWDAGITPGDRFKDGKPRLTVIVRCFDLKHAFKTGNKIRAYMREWIRLAKHTVEVFELDKPDVSNVLE